MKRTSVIDRGIAMMLIAAILAVSCSMPQSGPGAVSSSALISASGRAIEMYLDEVRAFVEEDIAVRGVLDGVDGYEVAERAMGETNGREYLEFVVSASDYSDTDAVLEAASSLVPEEEIDELRVKIDEARTRLFRETEGIMRALTPSQQKEFQQDLTKLVIKSAVLLTAAIVYAFVPDMILWGKVAAAAAVAIAAGIVAASIMAVVEYYRSDRDVGETFENWLENVTTEPFVYWGIASSMMSIGQSLNRGAVVTSIIIGIFALYGIADDVKPMLEKYNFAA